MRKGAGGTHALASHILSVLTLGIVAAGMQPLSGRTTVAVGGPVIDKCFRREAVRSARPAGHELQVDADTARLHLAVVFHRAILLVSHHGGDGLTGVLLMLLDERNGLGGLSAMMPGLLQSGEIQPQFGGC